MLSNPDNHRTVWTTVGITNPQEQAAIKNMVASGAIYLAHPLMSYQTSIKLLANCIADAVIDLLPLRLLIYYYLKLLLTTASSYNPSSTDPITILETELAHSSWPYQIIIGLAEQDNLVGKKHEAKLYDLAKKHPQKLSLAIGGPDHFTIRLCLKQFHATIRNLARAENTPSS